MPTKTNNNETASFPTQYKKTISDYSGNPLIEALPEIMTEDDFSAAATYYPPFNDSEKLMSPEIRLHAVLRLLKYFQPMAHHIDLERKVSMALRSGYQARNPLLPLYKTRLRELKKSFTKGNSNEIEELTHLVINEDVPATGFTLIGVSGIGKTTALKKILKLYPQVILHTEYNGHPLNLYQIVWIKIDCPHGGSLKDLCIDFFGEIDKLIGTNYKEKHGSRRNPDYLMLSQMCQIALDHSLGMLIIDELQNLDQAKSGGKAQMLNFFVKLDNNFGVPVITVGTNKAIKILQGEFRQGRRREGIGSLYWDRFNLEDDSQKDVWDFFISPLFDFQFTEESAVFDNNFSEILYDESQGVTDVAIKLYILSQFRAISTNCKKITPALMKQVALEDLKLIRPMLDALRSGDPDRIAKYDDIRPLDVKGFYEEYKKKLSIVSQRKLEKLREKIKLQGNEELELKQLILELLNMGMLPKQAKFFGDYAYAERSSEDNLLTLVEKAGQMELEGSKRTIKNESEETQKSKTEKTTKRYISGDLRRIVDEAKFSQTAAYQTLKNYSIIKSPLDEFII